MLTVGSVWGTVWLSTVALNATRPGGARHRRGRTRGARRATGGGPRTTSRCARRATWASISVVSPVESMNVTSARSSTTAWPWWRKRCSISTSSGAVAMSSSPWSDEHAISAEVGDLRDLPARGTMRARPRDATALQCSAAGRTTPWCRRRSPRPSGPPGGRRGRGRSRRARPARRSRGAGVKPSPWSWTSTRISEFQSACSSTGPGAPAVADRVGDQLGDEQLAACRSTPSSRSGSIASHTLVRARPPSRTPGEGQVEHSVRIADEACPMSERAETVAISVVTVSSRDGVRRLGAARARGDAPVAHRDHDRRAGGHRGVVGGADDARALAPRGRRAARRP